MSMAEKEQLLSEIRQSSGHEETENSLAGLIHRWLECQDAQKASQALVRALSTQGHGDTIWPRSGIWPLPPG